MLYSYINPQKKTPLTKDFWLLIIFFGSTIFMLSGTYMFLFFSSLKHQEDKKNILNESTLISKNIESINMKISTIEKEILVSNDINIKNSVMKDSINNLFDLIPNTITLSEAKILQNGLILYGTTPNKDIYNFMLQAPLRSIFNKTYSSFYPAGNGWLNFVSTNYLEDESVPNE